MNTTLKDIKRFITTQSAYKFFQIIASELSQDKEKLYDMYAKSNDEDLLVVMERLEVSCMDKYKEHLVVYAGFIENGKVFVLNKKHKILFFLAGSENGNARLIPNYNPLNVDIIEASYQIDQILGNSSEDVWVVSKNEEELIITLDKIIKN